MQVSSSFQSDMAIQQKDTIVVVCAADNNYAMPLAVTIRSALENLDRSRKLLLFIIDDNIRPHTKQRILKSLAHKQCEIRWLPKPKNLSNQASTLETMPSLQVLSHATWYRLLIPDLLPQQLSKAIYLDCDLVINCDLGKLWDMKVGDNYLLAACTKYVRYVSHERGLINWKELGFAPDDKYLSAGVLVFNLEKWRTDRLCDTALNYIAQNSQHIRWHDNDVLVAIVRDRWGELDLRWNSTEARYMTQEEIEDAYILHYTSPEKPWSAIGPNPAKDLFFHYLRMTEWKGFRQTVPQRLWRRLKRETKQRLKIA